MNKAIPETAGHLVAIGGAEDKESEMEVLRRVFELAPGGNGEVAVFVTASGFPDDVFAAYDAAFRQLGAADVHQCNPRERRNAADSELVDIVERCGVFFFSGGDQLRLTNTLGGSPVLEALRTSYLEHGAVIAGTSAGAMAQSTTMITGSSSVDALHKGSVQMASGLGFVDGVIIDSHFLERGRFTRLMEVGATNPEQLGIGLGEDAGVIIHPNRVLEAVGPGHVILVDSRDLATSNVAEASEGDPVAIENVVMHALINGHGFDIDGRRYLDGESLEASVGRQA